MDERKVHIDEFFRRQMENHTETPPPAVWEALEQRLNQPGRKKPFPVWWFWTIAGLIFISATAIMAGYISNNGKTTAGEQAEPANAIAGTAYTGTTAHMGAHSSSSESNSSATQKAPAQQQPNSDSTTAINNTKPGSSTPIEKAKSNATTTTSNSIQQPSQNNNDQAGLNRNKPARPQAGKTGGAGPSIASASGIKGNQAMPALLADHTGNINTPASEISAGRDEQPDDQRVSNNSTGNSAPGRNNRIVPPLLLASINPRSVADILQAQRQLNLAGLENDVYAIPEIALQAGDQPLLSADTSKKKLNFLPPGEDSLDQTVFPVDTKKKVPLPLSFGIKAGYSLGFNSTWNANKWAIAPYIAYGLPSHFSLILQPTFHIGNVKAGVLANSQHDYYEIKSSSFDSTARVSRGKVDSSILTANPPDTIFRTYAYGQVYDSIHVGYGVKSKQAWDIELPLMVKYQVNKSFAFILGGSVTYSSVIQTMEEVNRDAGLTKSSKETIDPATYYVTTQGQPPPDGPARKSFSDLFTYSTDPFSNYQARQIAVSNNFFRYGFMVGASYTFRERWMIDVLLHKTGVNATAVPDKEIQKIYTQPYLRIMIGYKLWK